MALPHSPQSHLDTDTALGLSDVNLFEGTCHGTVKCLAPSMGGSPQPPYTGSSGILWAQVVQESVTADDCVVVVEIVALRGGSCIAIVLVHGRLQRVRVMLCNPIFETVLINFEPVDITTILVVAVKDVFQGKCKSSA